MIDGRRVKELLRRVNGDDLGRLLAALTAEARHDLGDVLGLRVGAHLPRTGNLVLTKLRSASGDRRGEALRVLAEPLVVVAESLIGPERVADPSVDDIRRLLPDLRATFGDLLVEILLTQMVVDEVDGADSIRGALAEPRSEEPGQAVDLAEISRPQDQPEPAAVAPEEPPPKPQGVVPPDPEPQPRPPEPEPEPPPPEPEPMPEPEPTPEPPAIALAPEPGDVVDEEPSTDDVESLLADDAATAAELDVEPLFTPLDIAVIRAVVASVNQEVGAPDADAVVELVDELVRLNTTRHGSYFHLGFLEALDPRVPGPPPEGLNEQRRRWYRFGRLTGLVRQGDLAAIRAEVTDHTDESLLVLSDLRLGMSLVAPVIEAVLESDPSMAATVLEARRGQPFRDLEAAVRAVYQRARRLLVERRASDAERLYEALDEWRHLPGTVISPDGAELDFAVDLLRRRSACRRSVDDFAGAEAVLATVDPGGLSDRDRAVLATERGFVQARVGHLGHVGFPADDPGAETLLERLRPGLVHFEEAVRLHPRAPRASYMLGLAAWCRGDFEAAAPLLERAAGRMRGDALYEQTGAPSAARFHYAAALLGALHEGDDGPAFKVMTDELDRGYRPPLRSVHSVIDAFGAHSSRHAVPFVTTLLHRHPDLAAVVAEPVADLAHIGARGAASLLRRTLARVPLGADRRFALLEAALEGAALEGDRDEIEATVEVISEVLVRAVDPALDTRWEKRLGDDHDLREVLEPHHADLERVEVLRRLGRVEEAGSVVLNLFHRAVADALPHYDPADLLELLEELGADEETVAGARRHLPEPPPPPRAGDPVLEALGWQPVNVLFVGGNETQEAYRDLVDDALRQRYDDRVAVTWEFPGWSPNWKPVTDRVEAALPEADALVIMQFVRTNLGRHLRRVCDDHDVPWIPCTGHGRGSIERSLHRAVRVAAERLREKKRMGTAS